MFEGPWGFERPEARTASTDDDQGDAEDLEASAEALPSAPSPADPEGEASRPWAHLLLSVIATSGVIAAAAATFWITRPATSPATAVPGAGLLVLSSQPPGAVVHVDGANLGTTPLVLTLPAGDHALQVSLDDTQFVHLVASVSAGAEWRRHVTLAPVASAAVAPTLRAETERAGASGWLSVPSPIELQIVEDGRLLGVSRSGRIPVPAGRHVLDLVNAPLGLRQRATVVVDPDRTATVRIDLPTAPLDVNALPWANVTIDDRAYGETPLANVALRVGEHAVTLRHPTLGEHTVLVTVRLGSLNRISVDLRK